nr:DNA-directed DNA polymerase [Tanacetum cinerariifolium]
MKPQVFYDNNLKQALGFQNPFYLNKAHQIRPILYDGRVIAKKTNVISIADSEETLMLEEESQLKMFLKQSDPMVLEKKVNIKPINYAELNRLSKDFAELQAKDTTIKKLKAHVKCVNETSTSKSVKKDFDEIETINIELKHRVIKLIAENEHLKQTYKQLYDSIKPSREKVVVITALKNDLRNLKGKEFADKADQLSNATTIALGMYKLDLVILASKDLVIIKGCLVQLGFCKLGLLKITLDLINKLSRFPTPPLACSFFSLRATVTSSSKLSRDQTSKLTSFTNPTPKGRIRRSSKQKVENSNFEENPLPPEVPMAENQTMAQLLQAPTEGYQDAIVIPEIGAARIWIEKEPPRSILTWDDLVSKFINQFFPPSKTTNLHNEITRFQQRFDKSFSEAWDRFNDLLRACPHHGFFKLHQLDTFYNALNVNDQDSLNSVAGGNFLDKMPADCLKIIESKSKDMVRALLLDKKNQYSAPTPSPTPTPIKAVEPNCVTYGGTEVTKDQVQTPNSQSTAPVQPTVVNFESENQVSEPVVAPVSASMPNLKPSIPYPSRSDNERRHDQANEQIEKFYEIFKDMSFEISFTDALILLPKFASTLKALVGNKEKLSEMARTPMNEHCLAVILNKLPKKLGDPEKFLNPCEFLGMDECLALADLGVSINLMPLFVWKGHSLPELTPTCMTLELADRSVSNPISIAKDVLVKVGVFHFPADFVVVDFEPDPRVPLILESSPTPSDDPIVSTTSPTLTPFGDSDFLLFEEADAFLGDNKLPVIIAKELGDEEKSALIKVLNSHKRAITWKLFDIQGGFTVVANEENELIPTHLVTGWRVCIDYRKLNEATRKDHFPLPFMDQMLERLAGNEYYCFLDGFFGYFQIPIDLHDQEKTTFTCPYGTFAYRRMPFGLCNAPGTFQRCMLAIFHDMVEKTMEVFMDDFLIFGNSFKNCLSRLDKMLQRRFIKNFSKISRPMTHLLEKDTPFVFSEDCIKAFQMLKKKLTEAPILLALNYDLPFELMCDASDFAIGAVLGQRHEKHFWPIHYASKTLTDAESNYTTTEKEMLAVVYAFEKFQSYLIMNKCIVHTDHSTLKYLFAKKDAKARLLRWVLLLQEFDFDVIDTKGAENLMADHLSRLENPYENVLDPKEINETFPLETLSMILSGKLKSRWSGPFTIAKVFPYGTVELSQSNGPNFKVNVHRIKHYFGGDVPQLVVPDLKTFPLDQP